MRTPPTSRMFITLLNYFTAHCSAHPLYTDNGDSYCVTVEPDLIDIEKGKSNQ